MTEQLFHEEYVKDIPGEIIQGIPESVKNLANRVSQIFEDESLTAYLRLENIMAVMTAIEKVESSLKSGLHMASAMRYELEEELEQRKCAAKEEDKAFRLEREAAERDAYPDGLGNAS